MVSRKEGFTKLRELLVSAESNYDHGRRIIGRKKIMAAYKFLGKFDHHIERWPAEEAEG